MLAIFLVKLSSLYLISPNPCIFLFNFSLPLLVERGQRTDDLLSGVVPPARTANYQSQTIDSESERIDTATDGDEDYQ